MIKSDLTTCDEALWITNAIFEAIDWTFRNVMHLTDLKSAEKLSAAKTVLLGGDIRQIFLVVIKEIKDTVAASTNRSYIWQHVKCFVL